MSDVAGSPAAKRTGRNTEFFRACRYLYPYRRMVFVSIVAAFFVGLASAASLGGMLPILRVLINEDTLQTWMDRQVVESKLGVTLAGDGESGAAAGSPDPRGAEVIGRIVRVERRGPAAAAGVKVGDSLTQPIEMVARESVDVVSVESAGRGPVVVKGRDASWHLRLGQRISRYFPTDRGWGSVKTIAMVFGAIAVLGFLGNIIRFFQEYLSDRAAISAVNDLRRGLYDHVLHIPMTFFGLSGTSDVTSRLVSDSQMLQDGFKTILGQMVQEPIKASFAFALALWIDWRLTMFIVIFAPVMGVVIKRFGKKMRRASRAALQKNASLLGQIDGTLTGIRVVKAAGAERFERRRFGTIMKQLKSEQLSMARYEALSTPVIEQFTFLLAGVILVFAAYLLFVRQTLDQSEFLVFLGCMAAIAESLRRTSKLNTVLARSNSAAARVFEILDMPVERNRQKAQRHEGTEARSGEAAGNGRDSALVAAPSSVTPCLRASVPSCLHRIKLPPIARDIVFDDVSFTYANTTLPAVAGVSLRVAKGQSVAVVGRNGSGKTTLLALLPRFYDPQSGRILIDGVDVRHVTLRSLRRQIGIVTQDAVVFPGTVAENIAYGHPLAARLKDPNPAPAVRRLREDVEAAAKRAFCHDFIREKPQGYDTPLDGLGAQLSGGQRQRLNIARAILRSSPILVLDEATSQVDAESEHLIQQAIESLMQERTTFVIAHRFSTILSASTIVVMDKGRIVGQGKHDELLNTCETYSQLYERQLVAAS